MPVAETVNTEKGPGQLSGRVGEHAGRWRRSRRTVRERNGWYVRTREGASLGPYVTEFDADIVAALLIGQLAQANTPETCRRIIYNFRHDDRFHRVGINLDDAPNRAG